MVILATILTYRQGAFQPRNAEIDGTKTEFDAVCFASGDSGSAAGLVLLVILIAGLVLLVLIGGAILLILILVHGKSSKYFLR